MDKNAASMRRHIALDGEVAMTESEMRERLARMEALLEFLAKRADEDRALELERLARMEPK